MKYLPAIAWTLGLLFFVVAEICKHSGIHLPDWVGILFLPVAAYLWIYDWPGWKDLGKEEKKPNTARGSRKLPTDSPRRYTGPFWNKPSDAYLDANVRPFSARQEDVVYLLSIAVFAVFVFVLLHH